MSATITASTFKPTQSVQLKSAIITDQKPNFRIKTLKNPMSQSVKILKKPEGLFETEEPQKDGENSQEKKYHYNLNAHQCPLHPSFTINRVFLKSISQKLFYCTQCVIEADPTINPYLVPIEKALDEIISRFSAISDMKIESGPSEMLLDIPRNQDKFLSVFNGHVERQKERILQDFKILEDSYLNFIDLKRKQILSELDNQVKLFAKNFDDYNSKLMRYFHTDNDKESSLTEDELVKQYNSISDLSDLELFVRGYLSESEDISSFLQVQPMERNSVILDNLNNFRKQIEAMNENLPQVPLLNNKKIESITKTLINAADQILKPLVKVEGEIVSLKACSIDSKIVNYQDMSILRNYLAGEGEYQMKLIARASKDGSDFDKVTQSALGLWKSLILVKTQSGKIFGCFRVTQKGSLTFCLNDKSLKTDVGDPIQKLGLYSLSQSFKLTWKQKCRYNAKIFETIQELEIPISIPKAICLGQIEYGNEILKEGEEREFYHRYLHGIEEYEVFEIISNHKSTFSL